MQQCAGDWWPLSPRRSRVAHAAPLATDTEICDTVRLRGRNEDWLFPGLSGGAKGKISFSGQITQRVYKATGLRMTVHQFRHAAGALILQHRPGEYELVRQLLGHRNVQTTINAYIGVENIHASKIFSKIVMQHLDDDLEAAE